MNGVYLYFENKHFPVDRYRDFKIRFGKLIYKKITTTTGTGTTACTTTTTM